MHTDEYGITLSREVNICNRKLKEIRLFLAKMEEKYHMKTDAFIGECTGTEHKDNRDFAEWKENHEALKTWMQLKEQYDEIYRNMR
ncbi:MAG: hypothetical protein HZB31_12190 [Nitrospirae bacterium]|nr:hypothetical protein [Nitrospirota bacterium]